ncbi:hypothetical protein Bca101_040079 [Brassica carinata]
MAGLTLFFSFLSLSLIISGARSRVLSPLPLNNSILISDGVHDVSDYKFLTLDPTKTLSGTECEHVYGFLPCANNVGGYVFQVLTFGCLLIVGDYFLSVGRSQLFLIFDVGFYGGIIFPLLTMFPRIVLMLANGLSLGSDVANSFVDNNVGVTAGYTVFALTIQWGACVVFRITGPKARVDVGTKNKKTVGAMLLSLAPFLMVTLSALSTFVSFRRSYSSLLKLGSLFEITDTNGDGKIQISELKDFNIEFWNFGVMKCELDKHAKDFLQKFDENNDGELDEEEFEKGIKDMLKKGEFKFDSVDDEKEAHSPFMMNIELLSISAGVPSFYIVFVMIPLARNLKNTLSARFCRPKDKEKVSLHTFSEIYKDITMNNLMGMSIILAVIYARGLTWNCSVEALILVIVGLAIGLPAYMRSTYPFWICLFAFAMYICSLVLVYLRYQFLD